MKIFGIDEDKKDVEKENEDVKREENDVEEEKTIENEEFKKLDIKEETKLNQQIKGETLGKKLGLEKAGIYGGEKLVRISKSQLRSKEGISNSAVDIMAVVKKDGTAVILGEDILKPNRGEGTNPTQENITMDNNDGTIDKEINTTSYEIVQGNGKEYINVGYDEISGKEIKYSMYSHQHGKYVDIELETNRTYYQNPKVREFLKDRNEGVHEADDILSLYSENELNDIARNILDNENNGIGEIYNQKDVINKIIEKIEEKGYKKEQYNELISEVEEEMKESAKGEIVRGNIDQTI